ncbi:hypothetical protein ACFXDO_09015 [Streptomyces nigra]|uniref:hypothetical protein n=1 Tax=Streptomyces nigra TaxID=1827580 RepID=UPI0036793FF1
MTEEFECQLKRTLKESAEAWQPDVERLVQGGIVLGRREKQFRRIASITVTLLIFLSIFVVALSV